LKEIGKATLIALTQARLAEARVLLDAGLYSGAYYLAGYAVELGLKALISDKFRAGIIPDPKFVQNIFVHDIEKLADTAGLKRAVADSVKTEPDFAANWAAVSEWSEQSRYTVNGEASARALVAAIDAADKGVLAWIARHY